MKFIIIKPGNLDTQSFMLIKKNLKCSFMKRSGDRRAQSNELMASSEELNKSNILFFWCISQAAT